MTSESKDAPSTTADVYCKIVEANRKTFLKKRSWLEEERSMLVTYELAEMSVRYKNHRGKRIKEEVQVQGLDEVV